MGEVHKQKVFYSGCGHSAVDGFMDYCPHCKIRALEAEVARLRETNESVAVCPKHVSEVTKGGCLVCECEAAEAEVDRLLSQAKGMEDFRRLYERARNRADLAETLNTELAEDCKRQAENTLKGYSKLATISAEVDRQAEDEGLWFQAETAPESYLQQELRKLHALIEDQTEDNVPEAP